MSVLLWCSAISPLWADEKIQFNRDVRPILSNHCFTCHGPDSATRESGLRLDRRESATQPAESGEIAIAPGNPATSELIRRISSADPDERMPPLEGPQPLTESQIDILKTWISQGAEYQPHWAFVAPRKKAPPIDASSQWARNDIDHFVLNRMKRAGFSPAPEADRETLIRRVAFDLTGLPPSLREIDAFLTDMSPKAYQRMVDRYLAADAYGEHMARNWLDLARYADTNGYQYDTERQQWVWRDWVIHAYNRNLPFDRFTVEQLAGDLLPEATPQQRLATGFNRNHGITIEGGIIDEEYRTEYVMDRLVTTGAVWLGLTVGCARCHEHKFDPISQREFYQLYAYFNQVPERGMRGFAPQEQIASPLSASQQVELEAELSQLREQLKSPLQVEPHLKAWTKRLASQKQAGWRVLKPSKMKSSGGSKLLLLDDNSILAGDANPDKDIYDISAETKGRGFTAVRLEALLDKSLPGGGPGRHSNSNFVLSEIELVVVSRADPSQVQTIKFVRAVADYSQKQYEVAKAIDGVIAGNNGWAVDGPTRKLSVAAMFVADKPFGFEDGAELKFRLRHEAGFRTHGIGRARLSITTDSIDTLQLKGPPADILRLAGIPAEQLSEAEHKRLVEYFLQRHDPRNKLRSRIAALEKRKSAGVPATMIMQDMSKPRATFVLKRGQYDQPKELVNAGVPMVFPQPAEKGPANRLSFARWLVDPRHPLTARVAVNRYWQRLFGIGLVKTAEDFGVQGELPSHPELLDWLAVEFVENGWDIKQMQRLIVNSATYRQSSRGGRSTYVRDPENRLLTRGPRLRLDAEQVRDAALATSGLLIHHVGGKSVFPYQPKGLWLELNNRPGYSKAYPQGSGDDLYRRSIYTFWKRTAPSPMMKTFDAPEREFCTIRRSRTNTPLQALLLLNGPQFVEAARKIAERMMREGGDTPEQRIEYGFRLVSSRRPKAAELALFRTVYEANLERFTKDRAAAMRLLQVGESPFDSALDIAQLAAFASLSRILLNLDETLTKG